MFCGWSFQPSARRFANSKLRPDNGPILTAMRLFRCHRFRSDGSPALHSAADSKRSQTPRSAPPFLTRRVGCAGEAQCPALCVPASSVDALARKTAAFTDAYRQIRARASVDSPCMLSASAGSTFRNAGRDLHPAWLEFYGYSCVIHRLPFMSQELAILRG